MLFDSTPFILHEHPSHPVLSPEWVWETLKPYLTPARVEKIEKVVAQRRFDILPVFENLYDLGNLSAALRTIEGLGIGHGLIIQESQRVKTSQRTTSGADKWLQLKTFSSTEQAIAFLKQHRLPILATTLSPKARPLDSIQIPRPCAIVFGNEHQGVSEKLLSASDEHVHIPMKGFVQSFNISVATALTLWISTSSSSSVEGPSTPLSPGPIYLKALYALKTLSSGRQILLNHWTKADR